MIRLKSTLLIVLLIPSTLQAGSKSKAIGEAVSYVLNRGGAKLGSESASQLTKQASRMASRYGDEGLAAFRKLGSRSLKLADDAGELGDEAVKLMSRHGDEALSIVKSPNRLSLCVNHGDDAARALIKHGQIAEPVIGQFGREAARASARLSSRNARRLAIMANGKTLKPELVDVVAKYGDKAMEFVWRNKGALATTAALAAFVSDPEPFLNGTATLTDAVAEHTVRPLAEIPASMAASVNWTPIAIVIVGALGFAVWNRWPGLFRSPESTR